MGGVGNGEMFRQPYSQMLSMNTSADRGWGGETRPNPYINETCCAYNLAKLTKDLKSLQPLLTQAKRIRNKTTELREAIDYADMVVDYVNNGSGTHDLIEKATAGLNEALKTVSDQMPQRRNEQ